MRGDGGGRAVRAEVGLVGPQLLRRALPLPLHTRLSLCKNKFHLGIADAVSPPDKKYIKVKVHMIQEEG